MARIGFVGLGNMGLPMARNLVAKGEQVGGFDLDPSRTTALGGAMGSAAASVAEAVRDAEVVITMLPEGHHVRAVYLERDGLLSLVKPGTLFIDCSTIDVETSRAVAAAAEAANCPMLDAPVSGGVGGAEAGTLTFMVGGDAADLEEARPILEKMGTAIIHAGPAGNGQAAKICNNMILGISMIAVSEAFVLAEKLGLAHDKLFEVGSRSSGQCWALTSYCPVPGPVPASPANRDYRAGFTADMMRKDLALAQEAARAVGAQLTLGAQAQQTYDLFVRSGNSTLDFSGIIHMIRK